MKIIVMVIEEKCDLLRYMQVSFVQDLHLPYSACLFWYYVAPGIAIS